MFKATKLIADEFERKGLKFDVDERGDFSVVSISMSNKTGSDEKYFFFSDDDKNDVTIRSGTIVRIPEEKADAALELINDLNKRYRFVRFTMDSDFDVCVRTDIPLRTADDRVGPVAMEMLVRMSKMYDDVYPLFMKCVWG